MDLRNFTSFGFYGPNTAQKWRPYWIFELLGPIKSEKVKFIKSPNQISRYSPKEGINHVSELLDGWFPQEGTFKSSFWVSQF